MKIYTKTGDKGETALFGGKRVPKGHPRIEAYGTVDELNSWIGLIRHRNIKPAHQEVLAEVQDRLFTVGSMLASDPEKLHKLKIPELVTMDIELLEKEIDKINEAVPPMKAFVLPGGNDEVSFCHIARCVCRRAERLAVNLADAEPVDPMVIQYLNRLSDYLFMLARQLSHDFGVAETEWKPKM